MYCRKCGHELKEGDMFCVHCGASADYNKPDAEESSAGKTSGNARKKRILVIIAACVAVLGIACGIIIGHGDKEPAKDEGKAPQEEFSEEKFLDEISPNIKMLNACITEDFYVEVDDTIEYYALYDSEEKAINRGQIAKLIEVPHEWMDPEEYSEKYPGYYIDLAYDIYHPVTNFNTVKEITNNAEKMISKKALNYVFEGDYEGRINMRFAEFKGTLYQITGDRIYDEEVYNEDSVIYDGREGSSYYVLIDSFLYDDLYHTDRLEIKKLNGDWVIANIQLDTDWTE